MKLALGWFLRGAMMGVADLVPGVSGGTIALITGIYPRLLAALAGIRPQCLQVLWQQGWRAFWQALDGTFLTLLGSGILSAIFLFSHAVGWMLTYAPMVLWGFFGGILLLALVALVQTVRWSAWRVLLAVLGASVALSLLWVDGFALPNTGWGIFLGGAIAISALMLPGISGSLILLLLGLYVPAMAAVRGLDISWLLIFAAGCATGVVLMSRLLHHLLQQYYGATLAVLTGLVAGALPRLWPWQTAVSALDWSLQWPDSGLSVGLGIMGVLLGLGFFWILQRWLQRVA